MGFDLTKLYINPEDRIKILELIIQKEAILNHEYTMIRMNGNPIHLVANIIGRFNNEGELEGLQGYVFDNSERYIALQANNKLAQAVEQSPVSIVITDTKGNIEYVNPKFCELTGYFPEEVLGENASLLKSGHTKPEEYQQMWDEILKGNEWRGEFLNKKKSGELYWESATISHVKSSEGDIANFIAVKEDITEKKRLEQIHEVQYNISNAVITTNDVEDFIRIVRTQLGKLLDVSNFYLALYDAESDYVSIPYYSDENDIIDSFPAGKTLTGYVIKTKRPFLGRQRDIDELVRSG